MSSLWWSRICIRRVAVLIDCVLVATYEIFLIHKKSCDFKKFPKPKCVSELSEQRWFLNTPYKTWFSADLASYIFGCPSSHLSSLHLTLYLHFLRDLVLCKFSSIHFFISFSSLHLIRHLFISLFISIFFWFSADLTWYIFRPLHHFQTPSSHFSSPYSSMHCCLQIWLDTFLDPLHLFMSLFSSIFCHLVISMYLNLTVHLAT